MEWRDLRRDLPRRHYWCVRGFVVREMGTLTDCTESRGTSTLKPESLGGVVQFRRGAESSQLPDSDSPASILASCSMGQLALGRISCGNLKQTNSPSGHPRRLSYIESGNFASSMDRGGFGGLAGLDGLDPAVSDAGRLILNGPKSRS